MKEGFLAIALISAFLALSIGWAQEEKETPSQKTREAIEKFKKAPAVAGKALEELKEEAKVKLQEALGTKAPAKETDPFALPPKKSQPETPRYAPEGARDPFRPLTLRPKVAKVKENLSPLERYDIGQLKLVAIVWNIQEPKALVEDAAGLGYIVKVGTPIGPNEGKVKAIKPTEVVIEESYVDFYGARKSQEVRMKLPED